MKIELSTKHLSLLHNPDAALHSERFSVSSLRFNDTIISCGDKDEILDKMKAYADELMELHRAISSMGENIQ